MTIYFLFAVNIDVSLVKLKTEADSNECSHDKPSTGMFAVSDDIFSAVSRLCILCDVCCLRCFDCYCNHVITQCVAKIKPGRSRINHWGGVQDCVDFRTFSLVSHASKIVKIVLKILAQIVEYCVKNAHLWTLRGLVNRKS